jgi:hypothetical protein
MVDAQSDNPAAKLTAQEINERIQIAQPKGDIARINYMRCQMALGT